MSPQPLLPPAGGISLSLIRARDRLNLRTHDVVLLTVDSMEEKALSRPATLALGALSLIAGSAVLLPLVLLLPDALTDLRDGRGLPGVNSALVYVFFLFLGGILCLYGVIFISGKPGRGAFLNLLLWFPSLVFIALATILVVVTGGIPPGGGRAIGGAYGIGFIGICVWSKRRRASRQEPHSARRSG
jgi:hypothetical protein